MPENAIIFDMDGTLVDSLSGIAQATNNILKLEGHPVHPIQDYQQFVGYGIDQLLSRALPVDFRYEEYVDVVLKKLSAEYSRTWRQHSKLYPGIGEMLSHFNDQDIPLAILSNKPHDFTIQFAEHYLSKWQFEEIAGASPNYPRKPAPDKAVKLANQLGIAYSSTFFVGDSNIDILTENDQALIKRAGDLGEQIKTWIKEGSKDLGIIGDVRGRGLMIGIEMVEDRETREPLNQEAVGNIIGGLLGRGMIMVPCGRFGNVFRFMPPLVITKNYAKKAVDILLETVKEVSG